LDHLSRRAELQVALVEFILWEGGGVVMGVS
jgi:hypothetical protein